MERNATPIIPPRKNARLRKGDALAHRDAAIAACRRFGGRLWKSWSGYHRRSLVESSVNGIRRLSERVISRTFERPVNELHVRAAILNRFRAGLPTGGGCGVATSGVGGSLVRGMIHATAPGQSEMPMRDPGRLQG